jgi:exodeoxyribonuclease VII large subunit
MEVYAVSQVTAYLRELLESDLHLADLWISGEVSNLSRPPSGHIYFTLKDGNAALRCVLFKRGLVVDDRSTGVSLENGAQVVAHGRISLYEVRGDLQFYVDFVQPEGVGLLQMEFERLKAQLEEEGLFDEARKRPLPRFPRRIGVVTSPVGAAFHDISNVLARRWPLLELILAPTAVQGPDAAPGIVAAIGALNHQADLDAMIVGRGGGSLEELWAFNEEVVARAIYGSRVPVVSAVGHETDYTIADYVADLRAPTPSAAAELVAPDRLEVNVRLGIMAASLLSVADDELEGRKADLSSTCTTMEASLPDVDRQRQRVDDLWRRGADRSEELVRGTGTRVESFAARLQSLSPYATLQRGYAVVQRDGQVITRVSDVAEGDRLGVRVRDGGFPVRVERPERKRARRVRRETARGGRRGVQPFLFQANDLPPDKKPPEDDDGG